MSIRNRVRSALIFCALFTLASSPPQAQETGTGGPPRGMRPGPEAFSALPPIEGGLNAASLDGALDAYMSKLSADEVFSGVVLIARDGRPVFQRPYGFADRSHEIPNTPRIHR